jgi:hypothetical protein
MSCLDLVCEIRLSCWYYNGMERSIDLLQQPLHDSKDSSLIAKEQQLMFIVMELTKLANYSGGPQLIVLRLTRVPSNHARNQALEQDEEALSCVMLMWTMGNVGPDQTGYVTYETEQALLSTVLRAS